MKSNDAEQAVAAEAGGRARDENLAERAANEPASASDLRAEQPLRSALFTDFYELTMARAYQAEAMTGTAVFELFFRALPHGRNFLLAAGLEDCLDWLETLRFTPSDLDYLHGLKLFPDDFLAKLADFRFTGEVWAVAEGSAVFPGEPLIQVIAPIMEAQLVETFLLNQINFQTVAASKAARVVLAARGRTVVDFGSRRAHGADAALKAARACRLAGGAGTSNVLAGKLYSIPVYGTMAHSYVQAHDDELDAFERFAELFPNTTLLVDTYDTLSGVRSVTELARRIGERFSPAAVRLDSGDLSVLAKTARRLLDEAGLRRVKIFASSELDERQIAALLDDGAPIDGFGVGTKMVVSPDAPFLDIAYKLVAYDEAPRMKLTSTKLSYPCRKQVWRVREQGRMIRDVVGRFDEPSPGGAPLLEPVFRAGQRLPAGRRGLAEARERVREELASLSEPLRSLDQAGEPYPVEFSGALRQEFEALRQKLSKRIRSA